MTTDTLGEIITFYSYKGGTGRSMALSNVACVLAEESFKDENVLMIDWDLEAPGLHRFFEDKFTRRLEEQGECTEELSKCLGLIDLFIELENITNKTKYKNEEDDEIIANNLIKKIDLKKFIIETDIPNLSLLKAGCFDEHYSSRVNSFNWERLYNRTPYLFISLAEKLCKHYKYILIDSRTGYTDISGICTALMPQKLVVVFTPNRQNYIGVSEIIHRATSYRRNSQDIRPLLVYPLPSRIESSRDDLRAEWRFGNSEKNIIGYQPMFEEIFKKVYDLNECNLNAYFEDVQIQQSPDFAYGEQIAVKIKETEDRFSLSKSYRIFTNWLLKSRTPWQPLNMSKDIIQNSLTGLDLSQQAEEFYKQELAESKRVLKPNYPKIAELMNNLADIYCLKQKYSEAEHLYKEAIDLYEMLLGSNNPTLAESLNNLAFLYRSIGKYHEAEPLYKRALSIYERTLGFNSSEVAVSLSNLAAMYFLQTKYDEAKLLYTMALDILEKNLRPNHSEAEDIKNRIKDCDKAKENKNKVE